MTAIRRRPETCCEPEGVNLGAREKKSQHPGARGSAPGSQARGGDARLDKEVGHRHDDGHRERAEQLGVDDGPPRGPRDVGRELLGRVSELLALVAGDLRPREPAVADPRVGVVARVAARHPPKELAVVDDKVGEGELVRVKDEGREAEGKRRDPEVGEPGDPEGRRDVEHAQREPEAHVDGRAGKARVEDRK